MERLEQSDTSLLISQFEAARAPIIWRRAMVERATGYSRSTLYLRISKDYGPNRSLWASVRSVGRRTK